MEKKHKYGQYFTGQAVADFMVSLITHPTDSTVMEPACGQGVFLDCLRKKGFQNLTGHEIDPTLADGDPAVKHRSFVLSPTSERCDVVIGNPPYIRWKNLEPELKEELAQSDLWRTYFNSLCDYSLLFILKSIMQLHEEGELIFICTEYWMNTTHSQSLRDYMCQHGYFSDIFLFKEAPLFEKVTASFVVFRYIRSEQRVPHIRLHRYTGKGLPDAEALQARSCFKETEIPAFQTGRRWVLASQETQERLRVFERNCEGNDRSLFTSLHRLGDYCEIGNGMVSGLDAAFKISGTDELTPEEEACRINVLKAKDLAQYRYKDISYYIYLPEGLAEKEVKELYPHFYRQLAPYKDKLNGRYNYNKDIPFWEFVFPRNKKLFERKEPRIFIPCKERISNKDYFRFCFAPSEVYPLQDLTGILKKEHCRESLEYLLAFLNNGRVFDWLRFNGIVKGGIVDFSEAPLASIPYRPIDWDNNEEVALHETITRATQDYLSSPDEAAMSVIHQSFNRLFHE